MARIAFAPCCAACCSSSSYASSRAFSQSSVSTVMFPPTIVWIPAARLPSTLLDRTVMPLTIPKFLTTRYPCRSVPVVTIELSTRPFMCVLSLRLRVFTPAILPLDIPIPTPLLSAMLGLRGNSLCHTGVRADRRRPLSALAGHSVARLRAPSPENRPGFFCPAHRRHLPVPRHGTRPRTQSCLLVRIRPPEL